MSSARSPAGAADVEARGRVLVVDPDARTRRKIARALLGMGFDVDTAEDADAALMLMSVRPADAALLDLDVGEARGAAMLAGVRARAPALVVVGTAALGATGLGAWAFDAGAYDVLEKQPADVAVFARALDRAVERARLGDAARALEGRLGAEQPFDDLIVTSARMQEVQRLVSAVARTTSTALIVGASGAGKSVVARAIHGRSTRAAMPLFALDCAAFPPERLEAELLALIVAADGATLLVDGVLALGESAQAKLLRVVTHGEIPQGGDRAPVRVDVRVLASTRDELEPSVRAGAFRDDLRFRLGAVIIRIPRLAQRPDDIPLLATHFLRAAARRLRRDVRRVSVEAMRALRAHPWPGNVRELEAALDHAVTVARGDVVFPQDLPFAAAMHRDAGALGDLGELPYPEAKERANEAFDRAYVEHLLGEARGNVSEAARRAGMDRSNFRRLMKKARFGEEDRSDKDGKFGPREVPPERARARGTHGVRG